MPRPTHTTLAARIRETAEVHGVPTWSVLLASWQILLQRLTGERSLAIGLRCDGRDYEELRPAMGPFASYVPFSCRLDESDSFSRVLTHVAAAATDATAAQEYFLWELLRDEKDIDPPCFSFCSLSNKIQQSLLVMGSRSQFWPTDSFFEPFQVQLVCWESEGSLGSRTHLR